MNLTSSDVTRLIEQLRAGDKNALAVLFDCYRDRLRRMVELRMDPRLRARLDASDVLQEAYLDVARDQLLCSTRDQQGQAPYSKERSVQFELSPSHGDWREFEVLFEAKASLTGLRLDPGVAGSRLEIDSIVLRMRQE